MTKSQKTVSMVKDFAKEIEDLKEKNIETSIKFKNVDDEIAELKESLGKEVSLNCVTHTEHVNNFEVCKSLCPQLIIGIRPGFD